MKYLLLLLAVLFTGLAQAQIQEKDLIGEWKLISASMHGVILDFETGTATEEPGTEGSYTADDLKKIERGMQGPHPFPIMVRFNQGSTVDVISKTTDPEKAEVEMFAYTLVQQDGKTCVVTSDDKWEVRLENGLMRFIFITPEDDSQIIMDYKK